MIEMNGLAHVGVFVKDLNRSVAFYRDILDFEKTWEFSATEEDGSVSKAAFVKNGNLVLELIQPGNPQERVDGRVDHVAILVKNIEAVRGELQARGVVFETEEIVHNQDAAPNGSKWILFRGPDQEHLELTEIL